MPNQPKVQVNLSKSYLARIENSIGSNLFRNLYAKVDGTESDVLEDGSLSCAMFVSIILQSFELIKKPHATILELIKDMEASGWKKSRNLKEGDVIVWEAIDQTGDGIKHAHIGFYMGANKAISNSTNKRSPIKHHFTFGTKAGKPKRRIIATYHHNKLK